MKILIAQDYLRNGGTERQSVFLANAFAAAGHATTLLTFRPSGPLEPTVSAAVNRISLQKRDAGFDWFVPRLGRTVQSLAPSVVLCMGRMANCWAGRIQAATSAPRSTAASVICSMRTGKPLPWFFRRSLRTCHHVVANSEEAKTTLVAEYSVPAEKVSVIYNSLIFSGDRLDSRERIDLSAVRDRLRRQYGAEPDTTVLLCVAMFRPEKNQRELIEIASALPADCDWQLWLAGDGSERRSCEQLVAARKLNERIKFVGFQRDPSELYSAADLAVHASWSESLSNFLIEAQAYGVPGVAYAAQGIVECFVPNETGWEIPRDDRAAFQATLLRLMTESPGTRRSRAEQARTFAHSRFDRQRQVRLYLDLFQRLTAGR